MFDLLKSLLSSVRDERGQYDPITLIVVVILVLILVFVLLRVAT